MIVERRSRACATSLCRHTVATATRHRGPCPQVQRLQEVALVAIEDGQRHRDTKSRTFRCVSLLRCMPTLTVTSGTRLLCSRSVNALRRSTSMRARTTPWRRRNQRLEICDARYEGGLSALPSRKVKVRRFDQTARKGGTGHCVVHLRPWPVQPARRLATRTPWTLLRGDTLSCNALGDSVR